MRILLEESVHICGFDKPFYGKNRSLLVVQIRIHVQEMFIWNMKEKKHVDNAIG